MRKVLLVNTNSEKAPYPVPPVGLCLLASVLQKRYHVRVFDAMFVPAEALAAVVRDFEPHYVGLGIRNVDNVVIDNPVYYLDRINETFVKPLRAATTAPLVAGGSGFSVFPFELVTQWNVDFGIAGEGEEVFVKLLEALDKGESGRGIPGVVARTSGKDEYSAHVLSSGRLDIPFSNIDSWIDFVPYRARGAYPVQTKRGCGHHCVYCIYPCIEGASYRRRSPQSIADEIEQAQARLGDVMFEFVDSTFNDPAGHAEDICRAIIAKKTAVRLRTMGINPAHASRELFDLMLAAGFTQIDCTPDSGSPTMLANLGKNFSIDQLARTAALIREANIPTMWFFVFGGPGETEQTIAETFAFIDKWINPLDMVYVMTGLRIYPGTDLCRIALQDRVIGPHDSMQRPVFYVSPLLGKKKIDYLVKQATASRLNCVPAAESTPSPDMMKRATELRARGNNREPMFRTLLRVRREMAGE